MEDKVIDERMRTSYQTQQKLMVLKFGTKEVMGKAFGTELSPNIENCQEKPFFLIDNTAEVWQNTIAQRHKVTVKVADFVFVVGEENNLGSFLWVLKRL